MITTNLTASPWSYCKALSLARLTWCYSIFFWSAAVCPSVHLSVGLLHSDFLSNLNQTWHEECLRFQMVGSNEESRHSPMRCVSDCFYNRACSHSNWQIVFDFCCFDQSATWVRYLFTPAWQLSICTLFLLNRIHS